MLCAALGDSVSNSDAVQQTIIVRPEGVPKRYVINQLIDCDAAIQPPATQARSLPLFTHTHALHTGHCVFHS